MEEEALNDAYKLFTQNGYDGDIHRFKTLIMSNEQALKDAHSLFSQSGYKGNVDAFSQLIGIKKKVPMESPSGSEPKPSTSESSTADGFYLFGPQDNGKPPTEGFGTIPEQIVNEPVAELYDEYLAAGVITPTQIQGIDKELDRQKRGDRTLWEDIDAVATGFLNTGMMIPLYKYDNKEDMLAAQAVKNRVDFLEALPKEKVEELNAYAARKSGDLSKETRNVFAENSIIEEKSKALINSIKHVEDAITRIQQSGKQVPIEGVKHYQGLIKELQGMALQYNDNVDIIESNNEDIGTFYEELEFFKKNYGGLEYYKDVMRLSAADMIAGLSEFGSSTLKMSTNPMDQVTALQWEQFNKDFRQEVSRQREFIKPMMSVNDIENANDFGKWLLEQSSAQIPVITVLAAGGSPIGLTTLGASAGGQKIGELRDQNDEIMKQISDQRALVNEMNKVIEDRQAQPNRSIEDRSFQIINIPAEGEGILSLEEMIKKRDEAAAQLEKLKDKPYSELEMYVAGLGVGAAEVLSERISLGILSKGKRTLKSIGTSKMIPQMRAGVKDRVFGFTRDTMTEGASNFVSQVAQNTIDILYLGNTDAHVLDETEDGLASGLAMGAGMNAVPAGIGMGAKAFMPRETIDEVKADAQKASDLLDEVERKKDVLDDKSKNMLIRKARNIVKGNNKKIAKAYEEVAAVLPKEDIKKLINIDKKANAILKQANTVKEMDISPEMKKELQSDLEKQVNKLKEEKNNLLDNAKEINELRKKGEPKKAEEPSVGDMSQVDRAQAPQEAQITEMDQEGGSQQAQPTPHTTPLVQEPTPTAQDPAAQDVPINRDESLVSERIEPAKPVEDKRVSFRFLGSTETGVLKEDGKILGDDGTIYRESQIENIKEIPINSLEDLSSTDISKPSGLKKVRDVLDTWDKSLDEFGKNTLGANIPVVVAKGAIKAMKNAIDTASTVADIISAGVNHLKSTDWYKNLNSKDKVEAEKSILKEIAKTQKENLGELSTIKKPKTRKEKLREILGGVPLVTLIDKKIFEPLANKAENYIAKKVTEGVASRNNIVRNLSKGVVSWYNGLPRNDKQLYRRIRVKGLQEAAYEKGLQTARELQTLINFDVESAKRVHSALDPEIYSESERVPYEALTPNEKALYDKLREINDKTHDLNYTLGLITEETYQKYKGNYIGRGYEVYKEEADDIEKRNLLGIFLNTNIYKQRKDISQWKIDNTINDPIYLTVNRMIQTERNAAVKSYSQFISKQPHYVSEVPRPGYTKLDGKAYGKLNGKFVLDFVAEDFKGYFYANEIMDSLYDVVKLYDKLKARQFMKKYHTVYSPVVQLGNFMSNNAFAFANGINIIELWSNLPGARKDLKNKTGDYITVLENGIIGSNVLTGDLTLSKEQQENIKLDERKKSKAIENLKKLDDKAQTLYQSSDDIMKIAAYKALRQTGLNEQEAVKRVFEGFQNYSVVGKIWDFASKIPIIGDAFVKFQADLQRIIKNAITKRPLTTATFLASLTWLAQISSLLSGEKEEERRIREGRGFIPKISIGYMDIPLVFKVGNKEVNLARFISPYYKYDIPQENWLEKITGFTPFQIKDVESKEMGQTSKYLDTPDVLLGSFWAAFMNDKDFRGKSIADPYATRYKESGLTEWEKMQNRFEYVSRSVVPLFSTAQDLYKSSQYGEDFYGRNKSVVDILMSKLVKIQTFKGEDYKNQALKQLRSIQYQQKIINEKIKSIKSSSTKRLSDTNELFSEGKISQEQRGRRIERIYNNYEERVSQQLFLLTKQQEKLNKIVKDFDGL